MRPKLQFNQSISQIAYSLAMRARITHPMNPIDITHTQYAIGPILEPPELRAMKNHHAMQQFRPPLANLPKTQTLWVLRLLLKM